MTFAAGPNGVLQGATVQMVTSDESTTPVEALPATRHHFVQWTRDGILFSTDNPLTLTGVMSDMALVAEFGVDTATVQFVAGPHGAVIGDSSQTLPVGGNAAPVLAQPEPGWSFLCWTVGGQVYSTSNPLTVLNVTDDMTLTAEFAAELHTVRFEAGPGGGLDGNTVQTISHGGTAAPVTALPLLGYQFTGWTVDGAPFSTDNPLSISAVTGDLTVVAQFAVTLCSVTFAAGPGGSLSGPAAQSVRFGETTAPVTAVPESGWRFAGWTLDGLDYSTQNPLILSGVTRDLALQAAFAPSTYTVRFAAGPNGALTGAAVQTVPHGGSTSLVGAVPNTGHHFVRWVAGETPYGTENPIALAGVTADLTLTAEFAVNTYTVVFLAGANGSLAGTTAQTLAHGTNAGPVAAVPAPGYHFARWLRDGTLFSTENPITLRNVAADTVLTAEFEINTYAVTFTSGPNGGLAGSSVQTVPHGAAPTPVTAIPNTGYHFLRWLLYGVSYSTAPTLVLPAVTGEMQFRAEFEINTYTVTFAAGAGGSLAGTPLQNLTHGSATQPVTAVPGEGYHFVRWTADGNHFSTGNPLIVGNVVGDLALTAEFEQNVYPVTFTPGPNGSVAGAPAQQIVHGADAQPVTAVPAVGYHFLRWTLGGQECSRDNPLTVSGVTGPMAFVAEFEINRYQVAFAGGPNGAVAPPDPQTVAHGADAAPVLAVPAAGYHFVRWTSGGAAFSTQNPLTVRAVTGDLTLTAEFEINVYTVRFLAGPHGSLAGTAVQQVPHGGSTEPVEAVADLEYMFASWDDGFALNPRVAANVTGDLTLTAQFRPANAVFPAGAFLARVDAEDVAAGWGLWDLSGHYEAQVGEAPLALDILHDTRGKITGTGTLNATAKNGAAIAIPLAVKGVARGSGGAVAVTLSAAGTQTGTPAEPGLKAAASVTLTLTLDVTNRRLLGAALLTQKVGAASTQTPAYCEMALPQGMDGTYEILFDLVPSGSRVTGTALLTLANRADYLFAVKGTYPGDVCTLSLSGHKTDPPAKSIKASVAVRTLEGNAAHLDRLNLTGYGQTLAK